MFASSNYNTSRRKVTITMLPMDLTDMMRHCTTCCTNELLMILRTEAAKTYSRFVYNY